LLYRGILEIGSIFLFGMHAVMELFRHGVQRSILIYQLYQVGVRSLSTTLITGAFVGAILAIQVNLQLKDFGAQSFLGGLSASVTIRNVGPVLIAFILSGKVGAYTSAELATMRVTDQIEAIRCLGMDPIRYLVAPRLLAVVIASFLLLIVGLVIALVGGGLISDLSLGVNWLSYLANIPVLVTQHSVNLGLIKSFVFGLLIAVICCYQGYNAKGGSAGVGKAVRATSVRSLVTILIVNYLFSFIQED
jgi:phospholipid/cholesterol/gamma-HCH transport system permease protein